MISRKKLRAFYEAKPERLQHADAFENWFKLARRASWQNFEDAKALFGQSDIASGKKLKRTAPIFDIGENKYRIITLIDYTRQTVLITHVPDHKEYDENNWKSLFTRGGGMATKVKQNKHSDLDTYMALIHRLPLKPIKDDAQHEQAVEIIGELMGRKLDSGASDYLDTLILLVNKYEDEHHTLTGVDLSPQDALRAIMSANGITQAQMGKIISSESAVSMFLKGDRGLSKSHIKALVERFRVDAALFL